MEKKLEEYRLKKREEQKVNDIKMNIKQLFFKRKPVGIHLKFVTIYSLQF